MDSYSRAVTEIARPIQKREEIFTPAIEIAQGVPTPPESHEGSLSADKIGDPNRFQPLRPSLETAKEIVRWLSPLTAS